MRGCVFVGLWAVVGGLLWGAEAQAYARGPLPEGLETCAAPEPGAPVTRKSDWRLYEKINDVQLAFEDLYQSNRRLPERAFYDSTRAQYILPAGLGREKVLPARMIAALKSQLENALLAGYADFLFYPDMGHVHLFTPELEGAPTGGSLHLVANRPASREANFDDPALLYLYHTAELIRLRLGDWFRGPLVDDEWLQWRYFSRNFIGTHEATSGTRVIFAKDERYNTVRAMPNHREVSVLYMSANKNGCFVLNGNRPWRYDLSLTN